jgi:L-iditol 2-dehydrogenase
MKALLLVDKRRLEITDLPVPAIAPADLLVRVKACGICGSDVHGYDGSTGRRIPPIVMGHEAAGVVEAVGPDVAGFTPGDRVTFDSTVWCGVCPFCRSGQVNLCDNRRVLGVSCAEYRRQGCFAEYVAIPQHIAYKLPDALSFEKAAMIEAVSIAVHAVGRVPSLLGKSVTVVGAGMIGQLIAQVVRIAGAGSLIVLDVDEGRLEKARAAGADLALNADAHDLQSTLLARTAGRGADVAFEAVGAGASFNTAFSCVRKGGSVILVGNTHPQVQFPLQAAVTREISLFGSCASAGEYPVCLDLLARGRISVDTLLSAVAPLEEGPAWFDRLYAREPGLMKVILAP